MNRWFVAAIFAISLFAPSAVFAQTQPLLTIGPALPSPASACVVGSMFVLNAAGSSDGMYICGVGTTEHVWVPLVAAVAVSGTALPPTCIEGALFTTLPLGIVYVCTAPNHWNQADGEKIISAIANNVFTTVLTITIPNESVNGVIEVVLSGALGAGGAVGAKEAASGRVVLIAFTRVQGITTDATLSVTTNAADARVAGATTIAQATQLTAVSGASNASQTFALQYRITRGSGSSDNHTAIVKYRLVSSDGPALNIQ